MLKLIPFLFSTALISCNVSKKNDTVSQAQTVTVKLLDMFVINDKYIVPGHPGFLQRNSKALGYDIELNSKKFTVGFIDYDGDDAFDGIGKDMIMIANFRSRLISINNRHGTHKVKVKAAVQYLKVDDAYFKVTLPDKDKLITVSALNKDEVPRGEILQVVTKVPFVDLPDFNDDNVNLGKYFGKDKLVFIFFWNMKPLPQTTENDAQIRALDKLAAYYSKKVSLVGVRVLFSEPFGIYNPAYLKEMQDSPWDNLISTEQFYEDMQQDLSFIKGVLASSNGEILDANLVPRELLDQIESNVYK